jgi:hypothetical protein
MIIFGFGFLLGGLTVFLGLGLLSLTRGSIKGAGSAITVGTFVQEAVRSKSYPGLTVLPGGKGQPSSYPERKQGAS